MTTDSRPKFDVLIVDDEDSVRENLAIFLEDEGYTVAEAITAELALEQLYQKSFRFLIVDLRLPAMDGAELIRRVHALGYPLHYFIHTASTEFSLPQELRAIGIRPEHVFHKPLKDMSIISNTLGALEPA